ncbi:phage holin family protein [Occultella kanbiaonis]|uniref:phage holin family protein n=1 Tax=Occultella kanbiaonis TaxID=2675754 RepID=UPI0013D212D2|nr:phage holin family protein [Occultella kanbiaonis]
MIRMLIQFAVNLGASALAFLLAWWLIPGVDLELTGFFIAVGIFTIIQSVLGPFVFNLARRYSAPLLGGIGLVSTLLSLVITSLLPGGLTIDGFGTWFVAALLVWFTTAIGSWILLAIFAKRRRTKQQGEDDARVVKRLHEQEQRERRATDEGGAPHTP